MVKTDSEIVKEMREWLNKKVDAFCKGKSGNILKQEEVLGELTQILGEEE